MAAGTGIIQPPGKYIQARNLKIYIEQHGHGEPILFLHGSMGTHADWLPYVSRLSEQFRLLIPDARGHGRTENPGGDITTDVLADDAVALLQALEIEQACFCGWSAGGDISLRIAQRHADMVKGLIIGGVTHRLSPSYRQTLQAMGLDGPGEINFAQAEKAVPHLIAAWQERHTQAPTHWKDLILQLSGEMWNPDLPSADDLKKISVPTLILWGDGDQFLPVEDAVELYRLLPNASLCVIPDADHFVTRTHIATAAAAIKAFLEDRN